MAGTLLHILLAEEALKAAAIPERIKEETRDARDDYRLGAVIFDLPYYENLPLQGFLRLFPWDFQYNRWGERMHLRAPSAFLCALVDRADTAAGRALALGALTHAAVDGVFHPEIERRVQTTPEGRAAPNRAHHSIETQMDIAVHEQYLGIPGIGCDYTRTALELSPTDGWSHLFRAALCDIHGEAPSSERTRRWLSGLRLFARLHNRPFPWVPRKAETSPELQKSALDLARTATATGAAYLEAACADSKHIERLAALKAVLPATDLVNGGPCLPPAHAEQPSRRPHIVK